MISISRLLSFLTRNAPTWDAAGTGNRLAKWTAPSTDFSTSLTPAMVRNRARDAHRNNPWARRAVSVLATSAVGGGIKPQLRLPSGRQEFTRAWNAWIDRCDFAGRRDFYGVQAATLREMVISGEVLIRFVLDPQQAIPLQLQVLGPEFLDTSRVDGRTLGGIEYDDAGRRVAYWLFAKHPAESPHMASVRVPAEQVIHLFEPLQPGFERGVSWLAPALLPLRELQEFMEATLVRQKVGALFTGFVRTPDGSNPVVSTAGVPALEPGAMIRLQPGEETEFPSLPDVGASFEPSVRAYLRSIASALSLPYELLSGDVSQVTFASGRHSLIEFRRQIEYLQHHILVFQFCRPVFDLWLRLAIASGMLPGTIEDYSSVRWIAPQIEMLDPAAETRNLVAQVRAGFLSRAEVVSRTGWDVEDIDAEIASDNARADRLGLVLDSDPRRVSQQGQAQTEAADAK
ncbi:MAG: phage portal protein [Bryobacterales bacterium]|nr:phage portal protein [Bryobacterales bacterium]